MRTDYFTFGSILPGRKFNSSSYKYGFNGKENDQESGTQDYGMRIYNPSLGKFLSVDPLQKEFAWNSSYAFAENDVIRAIDLDGAEKNFQIEYKDKSGTKLWYTVPYIKVHPGQEFGPLGQGNYVYYKDVNTGKMVGKYNETYEEAKPIRSTLQKLDKKAQESAPFHSVEVGVKLTERVGNSKFTQKASYTDDGKGLEGKVGNDSELSNISSSKIGLNAGAYIKGNINKPNNDATKVTFTLPLPDNGYINATYRLDDGKVESIEIGIGAKASPPQIEVKQKIAPISGNMTL